MKVAFFDFDGTITRKDTFIDFIIYAVGYRRFILKSLLTAPAIILFIFRIISNSKLKEIFLWIFFRNWDETHFKKIAWEYSVNRLPSLIKHSALERITWHKRQNHRIIIVSASIDYWLDGWCRMHNLELIGTRLVVKNGKITGRLLGKNCYGPEKVNRIKEYFRLEHIEFSYAYGNSRGDREMLAMADEKYYNFFV